MSPPQPQPSARPVNAMLQTQQFLLNQFSNEAPALKIHGDPSFDALTSFNEVPTARQLVEPTASTPTTGLLSDLASYQLGRESMHSSGMQPANVLLTQAATGEPPARSLSRELSLNVPVQDAERVSLFSTAGYQIGENTLDSRFHQANLKAFKLHPQLGRGDFLRLDGQQFVTAPLSDLRFCRRIIGVAGHLPPKYAISAPPPQNFASNVLESSTINRLEAEAALRNIGSLMLKHYPDTLTLLQQQYIQHEKQWDAQPEKQWNISTCVEDYRAYGDHILMNAIACGHHTLPEFLQGTFPGKLWTPEAVEQWINEFLSAYDGDEIYLPHELADRFENELQGETTELDEFLRMGSPVTNVCVAKGIGHFCDTVDFPTSTSVNGFDYVRAFLSGQPIMYDGFLSATYEPREAAKFTNKVASGSPRYVIDFSDSSGRSEVFRRHALSDLSNGDQRQVASIMLVIRARSARASVLNSEACKGIPNQKEVLFATGHVLLPVRAVRCESGYVLFADAYHREFVE